jgi:hypothetical protein
MMPLGSIPTRWGGVNKGWEGVMMGRGDNDGEGYKWDE